MKQIQFTERREFSYDGAVKIHVTGDVVTVHDGGVAMIANDDGSVKSLRTDKAARWVTRKAAVYVEASESEPEKPVDMAPEQVEEQAASVAPPAHESTEPPQKTAPAKKTGRRK